MKIKKKKTIWLATAFVFLFFSASVAFGERIEFTDLPKNIKNGILSILKQTPEEEKPQPYELLIKKVQTGTGAGAYQAGDIVAAEPEGRKWSPAEKNNYWIVKMTLTPNQAQKLVESKTKEAEAEEAEGEERPEQETVSRRKYYIPPEMLKEKNATPELKREAVKERN